jgi:hypothetical protein
MAKHINISLYRQCAILLANGVKPMHASHAAYHADGKERLPRYRVFRHYPAAAIAWQITRFEAP